MGTPGGGGVVHMRKRYIYTDNSEMIEKFQTNSVYYRITYKGVTNVYLGQHFNRKISVSLDFCKAIILLSKHCKISKFEH